MQRWTLIWREKNIFKTPILHLSFVLMLSCCRYSLFDHRDNQTKSIKRYTAWNYLGLFFVYALHPEMFKINFVPISLCVQNIKKCFKWKFSYQWPQYRTNMFGTRDISTIVTKTKLVWQFWCWFLIINLTEIYLINSETG